MGYLAPDLSAKRSVAARLEWLARHGLTVRVNYSAALDDEPWLVTLADTGTDVQVTYGNTLAAAVAAAYAAVEHSYA
jgi:hypothetical protein